MEVQKGEKIRRRALIFVHLKFEPAAQKPSAKRCREDATRTLESDFFGLALARM
jgi:hypothetical protein